MIEQRSTCSNRAMTKLRLDNIINLFSLTANLGLNDRETEHVFRWSNGEQFFQDGSFSNWDAKEPNDNVGKENCVEMYSTHGKWNDVACSYKLSYICQHPLGMFVW